MRLYRLVLYSSLLVLILAIVIPLITLRSFQGYLQAWFNFLVLLAPVYLLIGLLVLTRHISPSRRPAAALAVTAVLILGFFFGLVPAVFLGLFAAGVAAITLASRNAQTQRV